MICDGILSSPDSLKEFLTKSDFLMFQLDMRCWVNYSIKKSDWSYLMAMANFKFFDMVCLVNFLSN